VLERLSGEDSPNHRLEKLERLAPIGRIERGFLIPLLTKVDASLIVRATSRVPSLMRGKLTRCINGSVVILPGNVDAGTQAVNQL